MPSNLLSHETMMLELKQKHQVLTHIIGDNPILYFDIPMHGNIGDLLIMQGTMQFFKTYRLNVKNIFSALNFEEKKIKQDDVLVFHGGGNFGDLYELHQKHREEFVRKYKQNRIVILPQTIHFESEAEYEKCCRLFKKHSDLHICVRDTKSQILAQKMTDKVYLMPDMAHQLYPIKSNEKKDELNHALFISRIDKEADNSEDIKVDYDTKTDWPTLLKDYQKRINLHKRVQRKFKKEGWGSLTSVLTSKAWLLCANHLVKKSVDLFAAHDSIYTNRLHGHILACLMDKRNIVLDNSYGKNMAYIDQWTKHSEIVEIGK